MNLRVFASMVFMAALTACVSTAEREAEKARTLQLVETNIQLAASYLQQGQTEVARERLEKALVADPDSSQAHNMMGLLQWRLQDYAAAEYHFRKADDANDPDAQNNYGTFLCERSRIDEAKVWFDKAIANRLYKTPAEANQNAGLCLIKKPALAAAEGYLREALRLNPNLAPSLLNLARIHFGAGKYVSARGFMQRYFEQTADTPESLLLAVRIERALGDKKEEAKYVFKLRAKFSDSPEARQLQARPRKAKGS